MQNNGIIKLDQTLRELIEGGGFNGARKQICLKVGITQSALSQYMHGQAQPSLDRLVALARFFNVSLDYLVFGSQERLSSMPPDHGPVVRYIDYALASIQEKADEHNELIARISQALMKQISDVAKQVVVTMPRQTAGMLVDDEILILEEYNIETWLVSMNLQYDVIVSEETQEAAAGRFFSVVVRNLMRGRKYLFLLPGDVQDWRIHAESYREMLLKHCNNDYSVVNNCKFRVTQSPLMAGMALCKLDVAALVKEEPILFEHIRDSVDHDGWFGYTIPPSPHLRADAVMDIFHLEHAKKGYESMWKKADTI